MQIAAAAEAEVVAAAAREIAAEARAAARRAARYMSAPDDDDARREVEAANAALMAASSIQEQWRCSVATRSVPALAVPMAAHTAPMIGRDGQRTSYSLAAPYLPRCVAAVCLTC
jgi:hypothetical protein